MKYVAAILLFMMLLHLLSFSSYNWRNRNKLAAIGSAILGLTAFGLAYFVLFLSNYEM